MTWRRYALVCALVFLPAFAQADTKRFSFNFSRSWDDSGWQGEWQEVPGYPRIPRYTARILVPYGQSIKSVTFEARGSTRRQAFETVTVPFPRTECQSHVEDPDPYEFKDGETYPKSHVGKAVTVIKNGYRIAYIPLYPTRMIPSRGEAQIVDGVDLSVNLEDADEPSTYRGLPEDYDTVKELVTDASAIETYPQRKRGTRDYMYLAIAPKSFIDDTDADSLAALLKEKNLRGISTGKESLEDITKNYAGKDIQEKIRNAIKRHYQVDGVRYVLLVGNGYSILPSRRINLAVSNASANISSDMYYACLDGNFTTGQLDPACEVSVGRAPVSTLKEMRTFVRKARKFQAVSESDDAVWDTMHFGEKMDASTLASGLLEKLAYPKDARITKYYESLTAIYSASQAINAFNTTHFYTVNHMGHANSSYCMRFNSSQISSLTNPFPFFAITQGCHPGDISGVNWASQMVVSTEYGASAIVANSEYGWYNTGSSDGPSNQYHLAFYNAVFKKGIRSLGDAHFRGKDDLIPQLITDKYIRWVVYETNLLGDPEARLKFPF